MTDAPVLNSLLDNAKRINIALEEIRRVAPKVLSEKPPTTLNEIHVLQRVLEEERLDIKKEAKEFGEDQKEMQSRILSECDKFIPIA